MKRSIFAGLVVVGAAILMGQAVKPPPAEELAKADADIIGTDGAAKIAALATIHGWVKTGFVSDHLWRNWIPQLVKDDKQQDIADLAMEGILRRPDPAAIVPLQLARYQAFVALKKNDEGLEAAKSYFLVVEMKNSARGSDAIAMALAKAHPEDLEIVRKFRAEQGARVIAPAEGATPAVAAGIFAEIKVDKKPYEAQLAVYKAKTLFRDRLAYGDLLLITDQGAEAEKVFREVYQTAEPGDQLNQATEAIAKAIRRQDGNPVRAAAWFKTAQEQAATQAAAVAATKPATTAAATKPKADPNLP